MTDISLFFLNPYPRTIFKIDFRKRSWERKREKNMDWLLGTGNQTHNLVICPDWESNPQAFDV